MAWRQSRRVQNRAIVRRSGAKLAELASRGLDSAVISPAPPLFYYEVAASAGEAMSRATNAGLADFCRAAPSRLHWLAHVPMQDPELAAAVLSEARALGSIGAEVGTSVAGRRVDQPEFEPFWAAAEALGMPVLIHPAYNEAQSGLRDYYLDNVIGNLLETTIAIERLVCSRLLDRHPALRLIFVHGGGFFPYGAGRLRHAIGVRAELSGAPADPLVNRDRMFLRHGHPRRRSAQVPGGGGWPAKRVGGHGPSLRHGLAGSDRFAPRRRRRGRRYAHRRGEPRSSLRVNFVAREVTKRMTERIVDLTVSVGPETKSPPSTDMRVELRRHHRGPGFWQVTSIQQSLHTGSHVDSALHCFEEGGTTDAIRLEQVCGEAVLFDLGELPPSTEITAGMLRDADPGGVEGRIAIVRTAWTDRAWGDFPRFFVESPYLSLEAAEWLTELRPKAVCFDFFEEYAARLPDFTSEDFRVHRVPRPRHRDDRAGDATFGTGWSQLRVLRTVLQGCRGGGRTRPDLRTRDHVNRWV